MVPVRLVCRGIENTDAEFFFDGLKDLYPVKTADDIKKYIGYAVFGNDALYKGKIIFEFIYVSRNFVVNRDFENNSVVLTVDGKNVPDENIDGVLKNVIRLNQSQWTEFAVGSKHAAYDGIMKNISGYISSVFSDLNISSEHTAKSEEECNKRIESVDSKTDVLKSMYKPEDADREKLIALKKDIDRLKEESAKLSELIGAGNLGKVTAERIKTVEELLEREKSKATRIETDKKRIEKSRAIKEHFTLVAAVNTAESEAENVKKDLEALNSRYAKLEANVKAGYKVYKKKEEEFLAASKRVSAINEAFDELIRQNRETGKSDEYVTDLLDEYCKEGNDKLIKLREEFAEISSKRNETKKSIAEAEKELEDIRINADYSKAVRNGIKCEALVRELKTVIEETESSINEDEKNVSALKTEYARNEALLKMCSEGYAKVFGTLGKNKRTKANLVFELNEFEREKQSLYRNQILSATFLQDLNAIDKKISESADMMREYSEKRSALESAKETLSEYVKRCNEAIEQKTDELNKMLAEKKLFESIDGLEYGARCPVCSAPVSDKPDCERALTGLSEKEVNIRAELERLKQISTEYAEKSAKINLTLGGYESTELSGTSYLKSLEETKLAKLSALKSIYTESRVRNHEELTERLEKIIGEMAKYSAAVSDVKALSATEEYAKNANTLIKKQMAETVGKVLPAKRNSLTRIRDNLSDIEQEYGKIKQSLGDKTAEEQESYIADAEKREDELYSLIKKLYAEKDELDAKAEELNNEIGQYEGRAYKYEKGGKEYDYTTLCINIAAEQYNEIVDEIRRNEAEKLKVQDELIAIGRVVKDKQSAADELKAEIEELQNRYDVLISYIDTITKSESYESKLLKGTKYETFKGEVLEDKAIESISEEIKAHEEALIRYGCELDTLKAIMSDTHTEYENLSENVSAVGRKSELLEKLSAQYTEAAGRAEFTETIGAKIAQLGKEKAELQKRISDLTYIKEGNTDELLVIKINNSLNALMPGLRVKPKSNGLTLLSTDRFGNEKELDRIDAEEYVAVSVCAVNAIRQIISETLNSSALMRIVKVKANMLKEETRTRLKEFGKNNNIVLIFHK